MDDIVKRPAYDPNNLHPEDEEARKCDTKVDGIDWDEIIASTQDDWLAGRHAYNSADYPDEETAMRALAKFLDDIFDEVMRERDPPVPDVHATRPRRP